jgi:hypothetical protein
MTASNFLQSATQKLWNYYGGLKIISKLGAHANSDIIATSVASLNDFAD